MNTRKSTWIKLICIAIIPLMMLTAGCAKRDAQKALTAAQAARDDASGAQAPGYAPKAFTEADRLFSQAQQQFDAGSYKESIDLFNQAVPRFNDAKDFAIRQKPIIDGIVTKIDEALAKGTANIEAARAGNVLTSEDINPVQTAMDSLQQRMESEFRGEADEEKLNAFLAEVEQAVIQTEALALAHLKPQANTAKEEIQTLITRAQELKADVHVPGEYGQAVAKFKEIESAERDGQWQKIIDTAAELKAPLDQIIQASQEKAAGDILIQTQNQIAQAKQLNVQGVEAFTSAVQRADTAVQSGQTALQSKDYAGAINATDQAKAALKEAFQAVGQQAQQLIESAKTNLQNAIDQEAEKYAKAVVTQVQESIASAEQLLQAESYAQAFSAAQKAQKTSGQAVDAARRGKAQIALSTVENPFSVLHAQGGSQYAADAYKKALAVIQDLRGKMKSGEYEAVVAGSPDAAQVVKSAVQSLAQSTSTFISQAGNAIDNAKTAGAAEWVGVQFANAANLKAAAEKDQKSNKYLSSIRNAESAIKAAKDAEAKAYQLQSEQNLRKADDFMALAKKAEQDRLSPLAYRKSLESREETVRLLNQGKQKDAYENSLDAVKKAGRALNNLVMTAKEKTDSALVAEAMVYSEPEIKEALAFLTKAEEAQKARNFSAANQMAMESAKLADKAEDFTWKQRSFRLLKDLDGSKEELEFHLAPEKTPALYQKVLANLAEAQVQQIDADYKASYKYAALANDAKQSAWDSMEAELNLTVEELKQTANWMGENAMDPEGREIKVALLDTIPALETNIALKDWKAAYASAEKCLKTAGRTQSRLEQRNRSVMSKELQSSIRTYEKQGVLSILPEEKSQFKETFSSLRKPDEGETYSDVYQKFQNAAEAAEQLPDTILTEAQQHTEEVASILQQAEVAGASNYYKEWYRDLSSDLQMLRNAIQGQNFTEIAQYVRKLERESPRLLVATQEASAEDAYLSELEDNLNQMNNVMQDLGFLGAISPRLLVASRLTEFSMDETLNDMFRSLQGTMSVRTFQVNAEQLEENVIALNPPKKVVRIHKRALKSFKNFRIAAEAFVIYGDTDALDIKYRERAIKNGYDKLRQSLKLNEQILFDIKEARKMTGMEKFLRGFKRIESQFGDFYLNWGTN